MARSDGRIEPGQKLHGAISARAWNRMLDAADLVMGDSLAMGADGPSYASAPYTWVYAYNATGADVARWSACQITTTYIAPNDNVVGDSWGPSPNAAQFESMPTVVLTAHAEYLVKPWCVAIEPIKHLKLGRVAVAGVVQARIKVSSSFFRFVDIRNGTLETAEQGYARILWKEPGEGTNRWALLQLGCSEDRVLTATFPGTWDLGEEKTLTLTQENETGEFTETVKVINGLMNVQAGDNGGKCVLYRRAWDYRNPVLMDFVFSSLKGHDGAHPVLKRHESRVQWKTPSLNVEKDAEGKVTNVTLQWT